MGAKINPVKISKVVVVFLLHVPFLDYFNVVLVLENISYICFL
jgi:hypothetical protein